MTTNGGLILLYHRVIDLSLDPQSLCVSPDHFDEHLSVLRQRCSPMSLVQMVDAARDGRLPERAAAITFDDGYADNLDHAAPLLARHDAPATVFVTTGEVGTKQELWWDRLERICFEKDSLPQTLHLTVEGEVFRRDLGDAAAYDGRAQRDYGGWNVLATDADGPRQGLYRSLFDLLRPLPGAERHRLLDELVAWAGTTSQVRSTHCRLDDVAISRLAGNGLVDIGAHTVTHPILSRLRTEEQRAEILDARTHLEPIINRPVTGFSYPYGTRNDYSAETVDLVRDAGFVYACSNFVGKVRSGGDWFQLPRVIVRDWDGDTFGRRLEAWWADEK